MILLHLDYVFKILLVIRQNWRTNGTPEACAADVAACRVLCVLNVDTSTLLVRSSVPTCLNHLLMVSELVGLYDRLYVSIRLLVVSGLVFFITNA